MNDFENPIYRLGAARGQLDFFYSKAECFIGFAHWSETTKEQNGYLRKALKAKAQGIVKHDQLLNGKGLK